LNDEIVKNYWWKKLANAQQNSKKMNGDKIWERKPKEDEIKK